MPGLSYRRKLVLAVESGYRESMESRSALLRDLRKHGVRAPLSGHRGWE